MESTPQNTTIDLDAALRHRIAEIARVKGVSATDVIQAAIDQFTSSGGENQYGSSESLLAFMAKLSDALPDEALEGVPRDLAKNFHHYHHGHAIEE